VASPRHERFRAIQWLAVARLRLLHCRFVPRKIRVIRSYKLGEVQATKFSLTLPIQKKGALGQRIREKTEVSIFIAIY
jgi:hypothetical protein